MDDFLPLLKKLSQGYTLIELVIVLAVFTIITGGLVFSSRSADRVALQQASYALQSDLRYTQRMALIEGQRWGIQFDITKNQYHVFTLEPLNYHKTVLVPGGVKIIFTNAPTVVYLPRGTISSAFTVTLAKGRYEQSITGALGAGRIEIKNMITNPFSF